MAIASKGLDPEHSRLQLLFGDVSKAVSEGRLGAAFRFADTARRLAPEDRTCLLVYSRLLARVGAASKAIELLRGRDDQEELLAYSEALLEQGSLHDAADALQVLLSRYAIDSPANLSEFATRLCLMHEPGFPGWVGVDKSLSLVGQVRARNHLSIEFGDCALLPVISSRGQNGFDWFRCAVPSKCSGQLVIRTTEAPLIGSDISWPPQFNPAGWVLVENQTLVGRVQLKWAPTLPLSLVIADRTNHSGRRVVLQSGEESTHGMFYIPLSPVECNASELSVLVALPDGQYSPLMGSPVTLQTAAPRSIPEWPRQIPHSQQTSMPKAMVDIVVPVHSGYDETLTCLNSIFATTSRNDAEVIVVNDSSPDKNLCEALGRLANEDRITLLSNPSNLGFPGAANRGMSVHPDRDVVLVNADTELFGNWLERLRCAAYSADDIGTVTPLGEAASIVSYPGKVASSCTSAEAAEIDAIAREANAGKVVELPIGVGYCLYLKRDCLAEVGAFDETSYVKGYGEENDFCLRARGFGWRHAAAADLFVKHRGARSYGPSKQMLTERNGRLLNNLYPGYDAMVSDFVSADPLIDVRRSIDTKLLLKNAIDPVLLVTSDLPGGVKRHIDERRETLLAEGHTVLLLHGATTQRGDYLTVTVPGMHLENLVFRLPEELPLLRALLLQLKLFAIEVHHFAGLSSDVLESVTALGISYDVYVHDYSWICPRMTLASGEGTYCGEPPIEDCEKCIRLHGSALEESLTVEALRTRSSRILRDANSITVPCEDVRGRLSRYFAGAPVTVAPWETSIKRKFPTPPAITGRIRVAVVGAISEPKGHRVLLDCARDAEQRNLDLEFVVIGFTCDDESLLETGRVFITGPYKEPEISDLLNREQCHTAFFPCVIPETWCYALTHALTHGLAIVAFDLGAIAERLRFDVYSDLLPLGTAPSVVNDALLRSARRFTNSNENKEPAMDPTPDTKTTSSEDLSASVQTVTLPAGVYTFTVKGGNSAETTATELALPALQIGLAPKQSAADVEFVAREGTSDRWLSRSTDMIVAKIYSDSASLMLTSVRLPDSPPLAIDVKRLEEELAPEQLDSAAVDPSGAVSTQVLAHVQNLGDIPFADGLIGCVGGRLWIEAFAILSVGQLGPDSIEYYGVTADGYQTPWLTNQTLCGSRGAGIPLVACAIRLKPQFAEYDCSYTCKFLSGAVVGPRRNGELCNSDVPTDPLWGIELKIAPVLAESKQPGTEFQQANVA